ncbi:DNA-binding transcriptional regulator [Aureimonas endophytica]|uniref:DNA-binding transcriptional regulator n=1 Tax=Aureimonas endophytica TaxID=2027858 RepID=A0A917DZB4_9HYPH|nr:sugar-binding transcriptional regulator [Aureimonas endophytica]GGD86930.1 DNA-binding transcriptional regulator [Aureimonas endophytica]
MLVEAPKTREGREEASLAARAAWLYFSSGMTQADVAKRLGISSLKAHRLIARASRDGLVRIFVDAEVSECLELEDRLVERFKLDFCRVCPDLDENADLPLRALSLGGASFLKNEIERAEYDLIGIGYGRTLASAVAALPQVPAAEMRFVSVLGGFTRRFAANPYDVIHKLAERTGAEAFLIPLPTFANTAEDKQVLLNQPGIDGVFAMACSARLVLAGIGDVSRENFFYGTGLIGDAELELLAEAGAVGELLGHFFDAGGEVVATEFSRRALSPDIEQLRNAKVVALAGGAKKAAALGALLRSGILNGLIVDEATAVKLAGETGI